jgi:hypothetical protein
MVCMGAGLVGERQEVEAWLANPHRDRERFDGHFGNPSIVKDVGIFAVVMVISAVASVRQSWEGGEGKKYPERECKYLKMSVGPSSLRRSSVVSRVSSVW